jgi:hypothetical protein
MVLSCMFDKNKLLLSGIFDKIKLKQKNGKSYHVGNRCY